MHTPSQDRLRPVHNAAAYYQLSSLLPMMIPIVFVATSAPASHVALQPLRSSASVTHPVTLLQTSIQHPPPTPSRNPSTPFFTTMGGNVKVRIGKRTRYHSALVYRPGSQCTRMELAAGHVAQLKRSTFYLLYEIVSIVSTI